MESHKSYGIMTVHFQMDHLFDSNSSRELMIDSVQKMLNSISKLEGMLILKDGSEMMINANKINVSIYDICSENEL